MEGVIVELGICLEQNIQKKLSEKREKYVRLAMELSKLRRLQNWKKVLVVVSVTGIVTRTWDELKYIPGIGERQWKRINKRDAEDISGSEYYERCIEQWVRMVVGKKLNDNEHMLIQ